MILPQARLFLCVNKILIEHSFNRKKEATPKGVAQTEDKSPFWI